MKLTDQVRIEPTTLELECCCQTQWAKAPHSWLALSWTHNFNLQSESYQKGGKHPTPGKSGWVQTPVWRSRTSLSVTPGSLAVSWFAWVSPACLWTLQVQLFVSQPKHLNWFNVTVSKSPCSKDHIFNPAEVVKVISMYSELKFYTSWKHFHLRFSIFSQKVTKRMGNYPIQVKQCCWSSDWWHWELQCSWGYQSNEK